MIGRLYKINVGMTLEEATTAGYSPSQYVESLVPATEIASEEGEKRSFIFLFPNFVESQVTIYEQKIHLPIGSSRIHEVVQGVPLSSVTQKKGEDSEPSQL